MSLLPVDLSSRETQTLLVELPANQRDQEAEKQIIECLSSKKFNQQVISYQYDHRSYPLRVIHNPERKYVQPDPRETMTFDAAIIAKDPLPSPLKAHLRHLVKHNIQGDIICISDEKSEFEKFGSLKIVKYNHSKFKKEQGKLWQYVETVAFISAGSLVTMPLGRLNLVSAIAYNAIGYLTGKTAYLITQSNMQWYSKKIRRISGWALGILTSLGAGYGLLRQTSTPRTLWHSLLLTTISTAAGAALRYYVAWPIVRGPKGPSKKEFYQGVENWISKQPVETLEKLPDSWRVGRWGRIIDFFRFWNAPENNLVQDPS